MQQASDPQGGSSSLSIHEDLERLKFAMQASGVGLWEFRPADNSVYWDDKCRELFGIAAGNEIPYAEAIRFIHPEDRPKVDAAVQAALSGHNKGNYDIQYRTIGADDGKLRWVRFTGQAFFDDKGRPLRFGGIAQDMTELVTATQAQAEAQRLSDMAMESAGAGSFRINLETDEMEYSTSLARLFTGDEHQPVSRELLIDRIHPDDRPLREAAYRQANRTGRLYYRARTVWDDESHHWIEARGAYLPGPDGRPRIFAGVVQDITESLQAREAVEASEAKFRSLIEEAPVATALYAGEDLVIDTANETMIRLWGKTPAVLGMPLAEALPELEGQPFLGILRTILQTGETYHTRSSPADLVVDGRLQRFWFNFTYKPLFDESGKPNAILNMAVDITPEVLARGRQEEAQTALLNAIELAELGTWSLDIATGGIVVSERMLHWFGLTAEQAQLGEAVNAIVEGDRERVAAAIAAACEPGAPTYSEEYGVVNHLTGQRRTIHALGRVVRSPEGQPLRLDGTARDVTLERELQQTLERLVQKRTEELAATNEELQSTNEELQTTNEELAEANEQLLHSNEELAQYAYIASHDLQEPLRKIRMFSGLLTKQASLADENRPLVGRINQSAERMSMLISDLLEFSRLLNSDSQRQPVDLSLTLAAIVDDFELIIEEKAATVTVAALPRIEAVSLQMNQLFYNLLSNALKFVPADRRPEITVSARLLRSEEKASLIGHPLPDTRYFRITVTDNGIGFDAEYAEQIFEVFKRLHSRDAFAGSGIGLALCRRIVTNHRGVLYAESVPGEGTSFHVVLPERLEV